MAARSTLKVKVMGQGQPKGHNIGLWALVNVLLLDSYWDVDSVVGTESQCDSFYMGRRGVLIMQHFRLPSSS